MTAEGPTGAPLRQQIAEAIRPVIDDETLLRTGRSLGDLASMHVALVAADAVVALLDLTEERQQVVGRSTTGRPGLMVQRGKFRTRLVTPWLPTTPPDTSSSETT